MKNNNCPNEVDKVEILTLQDNYIEMTAGDSNNIISRARPLKAGEIRASVLAEHGYCALVKTTTNGRTRTLLFDFGFSEDGAACNAATLGVDMNQVEAAVLSHGHSDHTGGMERLTALIDKREIPLVVHPAVFKSPRYLKYGEDVKIHFPQFTRERATKAGLRVVESGDPYPLLDGDVLFLGEIPRQTDFEMGFPVAHYQENGVEAWDPIEDDTSIVMNLKGKGLIVLSGCAHAGIVNTVLQAVDVTGVSQVHVVMGGFHLSGPLFEAIIDRTTEELQKFNPAYVIPTHCTGRNAIMAMEREMPGQFILNMAGTTLTFAA
jgi:7,8-dihydropterin-6-yl-methyl-4-(beta-D-ribofuranosyl)aminobenzene 5'-phosphate synthase